MKDRLHFPFPLVFYTHAMPFHMVDDDNDQSVDIILVSDAILSFKSVIKFMQCNYVIVE